MRNMARAAYGPSAMSPDARFVMIEARGRGSKKEVIILEVGVEKAKERKESYCCYEGSREAVEGDES